jgi:hypothetical protein
VTLRCHAAVGGAVALAAIALGSTPTALGSTSPASGVADARSGAAPVTMPDTATLFPGNLTAIRPTRNDSDPEGDRLRVCKVEPEHYAGIKIDVFDDQRDYYLTARRSADPGTYTFTYYACDGTSMTPGTVTLTVQKLPRITVRKIAGRPGKLRVHNGAPFRIRVLYGDYNRDDAEGDVRIPRKASRVVSTRYTQITWFAFVMTPRGSGDEVGRGHVRGIRQHGSRARLLT